MKTGTLPEIFSRRCIRHHEDLPSDRGCWKNYTGYCSNQGFRKFELSSDIVGRDRYDGFRHRLSDGDGIFREAKTTVFRQRAVGGNVERWCEPFEALEGNSDAVFRFYLTGTYTDDGNDRVGQNSFLDHVRLCCVRSADGGESFGTETDLTADFQKQYPGGRPVISCSHLISCRDGSFKVPVCIRRTGGGSWTCRVLTGRTRSDGTVRWEWGGPLAPPDVPRPFMSEFSIAEIDGDRLLAICRVNHPDTPGKARKYRAVSSDGGKSWGRTEELRYADGGTFFSPDSCGFLLRHSSGRLYYLANILDGDADPWFTRSTLSIVEIEENIPAAIRATQQVIDCRQPDELPEVAISNFSCFEERETGHIIVQSPKSFRSKIDLHDTDLMEYRIGVGGGKAY